MSKKILTLDNVPVINKKIGKIDTIEKLKASTIYSIGDVVEVLGFHTKGDGAHHYRQKVDGTYNGLDAIDCVDGTKWKIVHNGEASISWFGFNSTNQTNDDLLEFICNNYKKILIDSPITINRTIELKKEGIIITGFGDSRYDKVITSTHNKPTFRFNPSTADNSNDQPKCPEFYNLTVRCSQFYEVFERTLPIADGGNYPYFLRPKVQKCFITFNGNVETQRDDSALYFSKAFDFSVSECNFRGFPNGAGIFRGCDISEFVFNRVEGFKREAVTSIRESTFGSDLKVEHCDLMIASCFSDETNTRFVINTTTVGDKILGNYFEYTGNVADNRLAFIRIGGNYPNIVNNRMEGSVGSGVTRIKYPVFINAGIHSIYIDGIYNSNSDLGIVKLEGIPIGLSNSRTKMITIKNIESREYIMSSGVGNKLVMDYSNFGKFTNDSDGSSSLLLDDNGAIIGSTGKNLHFSLLRTNPVFKTSGKFKLRFVYKSVSSMYAKIDNKSYNGGVLTDFYIPASTDYNVFEKEFSTSGDVFPYLVIVTNDSSRILSIEIEKVYISSFLNIEKLDTPYYTYKMQQQGIYNDYVTYRDELHEYENSQTTDDTMLLPVLQEPVIPESVKAFAEKYKLI